MLLRNLMSSTSLFSPLRAPDDENGATPSSDNNAAAGGDASNGGGDDNGAAAAANGDSNAAGSDAGADDPKPAAKDWRDREIATKHRQLQEVKRQKEDRERRLADLERENADLRAIAERRPPTKDGETPPADPPARKSATTHVAPDPDAVKAEAARIVAQDNYTRDCNAAVNKGKEKYGSKFEEALQRMETFTADDGVAITIDTMTMLLATDDPARVLYEFGNNPDTYQRIMALPPAKRANEMAKLAATPEPKKKPSNAPAPVDPVGGRAAPTNDELDDKLPDDEWYARRTAQKRKKWLAEQGRQTA